MNTNTRALSSLLPAAHPAAAAEARAASAVAPAPGMDFASLMGGARLQAAQAPAAASRPEPAPAAPQTPPPPAGNTSSQQQSRALNERRERERIHDRAAEQRAQQARQQAARSSSGAQAAGPAADAAGATEGDDKARPAADDKQVAVTPLAEWLASLNPATLQPPAAQGEAGASAQDALEAAGSDHPLSGAAEQQHQQQQRHAGGLRRGMPAAGAEATAPDAASAGERFELPAADAQAAAATSARVESAGPAAGKPNADAPAIVNNLTTPAAEVGGSAEAAAPAAVDVPTPATDADFPDVLATQVSVLVKDGVQQAELHLNPAEMGPISVQIAVDGSQAQVDFAAAAGATREIIESSLPMLAAALHEAGLTLAGGGVFEHGRHHAGSARQDGASSTSQRGGGVGDAGGPEGTAAAAPPARRVAHRGMLDLYA